MFISFKNSRILEFHIEILGSSPRMTQGRLGDDIVGNLEFLRINLEFPKDCFASVAMTKIIEFHIDIPKGAGG